MGRIAILGSYNLDLAAAVPRLPAPGETLRATGLLRGHGGKGSNQAVAAARAGARVRFAGCIGDDEAGRAARLLWQAEGIEDGAVLRPGTPTGVAMILVDRTGENQIVVAAGANDAVREADGTAAGALAAGDVALAQLEIPLAATLAFLTAARAAGAITVLNAAPAQAALPAALLAATDVLVVNEGEAAMLCGLPADSPAAVTGALLAQRGAGTVLVTAGARGAFLFAGDGTACHQPSAAVQVVDSTGAGDAFTGAFVAAMARGATAADALADGVAAGALACTRAGAVAGLPDRVAIAALRRTLPDARPTQAPDAAVAP